MTTDADRLTRLSSNWLRVSPSVRRRVAEAENSTSATKSGRDIDTGSLLTLSRTIASLKVATVPDSDVLKVTEDMFDRLANRGWKVDSFGERLELCLELAFLGWRQAAQLGLDSQVLEWMRVSDLLVGEESVAVDVLANFLYLPDSAKSRKLTEQFLGGAFEVFLSLAILRRDRNRVQLHVFRVASWLYHFISSRSAQDFKSGEKEFFLGEAAFLCTTIARGLGFHRTQEIWSRVSRTNFRQIPFARRVRLKLLCVRLHGLRDKHRMRNVLRWAERIIRALDENGLHYESLGCRIAVAFVYKTTGETHVAGALLREIVEECRSSTYRGYLAICLGNLSEILFSDGRIEESAAAIDEALEEGSASKDSMVLASVFGNIGTIRSLEGRQTRAFEAFREAIFHYASVGAVRWAAYYRVIVAEILLESGEWEAARRELGKAVPVLREENLTQEMVHAVRLLQSIPASIRNPWNKGERNEG